VLSTLYSKHSIFIIVLNVILLNVVMLSVVVLCIVVLNVVEPTVDMGPLTIAIYVLLEICQLLLTISEKLKP